jgi:hypothetical protein
MDTLNTKIKIIKDGINEIIDFSEPTYIPNQQSPQFLVTRVIQVSKEYDRRPDLIALAVYNDIRQVDMILKWNEISDPLSVREGDILIIPEKTGAKSFYVSPSKERTQTKSNFVDESKKSKKDKNRLIALAKLSAKTKNGSSQNVKTNELKPGESNININERNNQIIV